MSGTGFGAGYSEELSYAHSGMPYAHDVVTTWEAQYHDCTERLVGTPAGLTEGVLRNRSGSDVRAISLALSELSRPLSGRVVQIAGGRPNTWLSAHAS